MNESAGAIWKWIGELRKSQEVQGQIPMLIRGRSQLNSGAARRVSSGDINCHYLAGKPRLHHSDRRNQIGIPADNNVVIASVLVCVIQHKDRNVDVCSLLFGHLKEAATGKGASGTSASNGLVLELTQYDIDKRKRGQCPKVYVLIRTRGAVNQSGEVMDLLQIIMGSKEFKETLQIQPLEWCVPYRAIIQIEAVDIDNTAGRHFFSRKRKRAIM